MRYQGFTYTIYLTRNIYESFAAIKPVALRETSISFSHTNMDTPSAAEKEGIVAHISIMFYRGSSFDFAPGIFSTLP